ncbi:Sestrin homolog [Caenorhabditis elegans]|uniref:Sestrin homolog n=1 Tax=Caenorhabditis elegans TaxID=6239 RepID=SESN1_CAEEL|nr:Sestrin homolog [Caenorhabditis elegans]Q9N4D6.3 RecName: Full=Sestrin homolog [Caenorhabditis elegans]CCD68266.1 Sestrin homolog [Caenorhabditis elegans]|eukprot:NP_490664.2 Sestrin homolog [Caenorhabditis elegans]
MHTTTKRRKAMDWLNFDPIPEVDRLFRFTCKHPTLHVHMTGSYGHMFVDISDLPASARHYLALMAASRHRCLSLMDHHRRKFLEKGGQQMWLLGIDWSYMKFRKLDYLNRMLCHRPWMIHWKNLAVLFARRTPDGGPAFFSVCSLHHAVGIMSMTHAMCTVICCIGLERRVDLTQDEIDFLNIDDLDYWEARMSAYFRKVPDRRPTEVEYLISELKKTEKGQTRPPAKMCAMTTETIESLISAPAATYSSNRKNYSPVLLLANIDENGEDIMEKEPPCNYPIYSHHRTFGYIDFRKRPEKDIPPFRVEEFGWDHVYNTMNEYTDTLTSRLDRMFDHIRTLTGNMPSGSSHASGDGEPPAAVNQNEIDTAAFREAIWNYTQGLYGVRVDDYDYSKINRVLDKGTKTFIKLAACYPHKLTTEFTRALPGFKDSEKIHVVMMVAMARFQASMFHYTRAVCNYNAMCLSKKGWRKPLD